MAGRIWIPGGGGGADLDVVTASAENILSGKVIVDKDGNPLTGTMPDNTGTALTVATNGKTLIPKGYHDGTQYATNTQATMAGGTKTPTTSAQTIACNGKLMTSNIVIPAFSLPAASSIKKGVKVTIYGKSVTGTWEGYVSDTAYLYNKGAFGAGVTSYSKLVGANSTTISVSNGIITASDVAGSGAITMFRFDQTVDLTNWNYLKVIPTTSNIWTGVGIGIATWPNYTSASAVTLFDAYSETSLSSSTHCSTQICDISKYSGKYYVFFWFKMGSSSSQTRTAGIGQICVSNT